MADTEEHLAMADDPAAQRGAVPPPVDLIGHFRELGRALGPALFVAIVVGCAVFGFQAGFAPKQYSASVVTEIRPASQLVPGDAFIEQLRAPFMSLAIDENVLEQVLSELDVDWDVATLQRNLQMSPGPSPALLIFTATAPTPELAAEIARSIVVAVSQASFANYSRDSRREADQLEAAIAAEEARLLALESDGPAREGAQQYLAQLRDQLTTLQSSGGDTLSILATPEQNLAPISPRPLSEALVAGLAALIIAAEIIVVWRSRFGTKPNRTWGRRIAYKYRSYFDPSETKHGDLPPAIAAIATQLQRENRDVLILVGAGAVSPISDTAPADTANGRHRALRTLPLAGTWWQQADLGDTALGLVVVTTDSTDRAAADVALAQLTAFGVQTGLVVQSRRRRRPPADPKAADPSTTRSAGSETTKPARVRAGGSRRA